MLKEEIVKVASELLGEEASELECKSLSSLIGYELTKMPYFKKNYSNFHLIKEKGSSVINLFTYDVKNKCIKNKIEIDFLNGEDFKGHLDLKKSCFFINKEDLCFLKKLKECVKKSKNIKEVLDFIKKEDKTNCIFRFLDDRKRFLNFGKSNFADSEYLKRYTFSNDFFKKYGFLEDFLDLYNKNKIIERVLKLNDLDFGALINHQDALHYKNNERLPVVKKVLKNNQLYEKSLLKFLFQKDKKELKNNFYNNTFFIKDKNDFLREISNTLNNAFSLELTLEENKENLEKGVEKIIKKFPFILNEKTEKNKAEYYDKKAGVDSFYDFFSDFIENQKELFFSNSIDSINHSSFFNNNSNLLNLKDKDEFSCILIKDDYEIKAMTEISYKKIKYVDDMDYVSDLNFIINKKYINDKDAITALMKHTFSFLKNKGIYYVYLNNFNNENEFKILFPYLKEIEKNNETILINYKLNEGTLEGQTTIDESNFKRAEVKQFIIEHFIKDIIGSVFKKEQISSGDFKKLITNSLEFIKIDNNLNRKHKMYLNNKFIFHNDVNEALFFKESEQKLNNKIRLR